MEIFETLKYGLSLIELNKPGDVLEFGVFKGASIQIIRNSLNENFRVFGFDSFEGLPEDWEDTICKKGFFSTNGLIPEIKDVNFFKGLFEETIEEYLKIANQICFIHVDCDLYTSTKTIFEKLGHLINFNTIIVFDEWKYTNVDGEIKKGEEQKYFKEWINSFDKKYVEYHFNENCEQKLVRIL